MYDRETEEQARQREQDGWAKIFAAAVVLVGAVVIVASGGAATPFVIGAFVVAGTFQASNIIEGVQDVYYGSRGDKDTLSFNPLRDTVFMGNQEAYNVADFLVTSAAFAAVPGASAANLARSTGAPLSRVALAGTKAGGKAFAFNVSTDLFSSHVVMPAVAEATGSDEIAMASALVFGTMGGPSGRSPSHVMRSVDGPTGGVRNPGRAADGVESVGSTGRTVSRSLSEDLAMREVRSNPLDGAKNTGIELSDPRWSSSEGWLKMEKTINTCEGRITIHFNYNQRTGSFDDFKYK